MSYSTIFNQQKVRSSWGHADTKSDAEKKQIYSKVEKYLARAEEIKELVKTGDKGIAKTEAKTV